MDKTATHDCATSLAALASGRLGEYHGITGCTRADAETTLGPTPSGPDAVGGLFGPHRAYPAKPGAPHGLTLFFNGDRVTMIQILGPVVDRASYDILGAPDHKLPSRLEPTHEQQLWAQRGLVLHSDGRTISWLFAIAPTTVQAYLASPLAALEIRDEPLD